MKGELLQPNLKQKIANGEPQDDRPKYQLNKIACNHNHNTQFRRTQYFSDPNFLRFLLSGKGGQTENAQG